MLFYFNVEGVFMFLQDLTSFEANTGNMYVMFQNPNSNFLLYNLFWEVFI